jgi:hypothetical protein
MNSPPNAAAHATATINAKSEMTVLRSCLTLPWYAGIRQSDTT